MLPAWLSVDLRAAPSANVALVRGADDAVLVDAGEGQEPALARLAAWLGDARPSRVACTHWHPDHVGAVAALRAGALPPAPGGGHAAHVRAPVGTEHGPCADGDADTSGGGGGGRGGGGGAGGGGVRVLAHEAEAALLAQGDPDVVCDAAWLAQPVAPYAVDVALADGDVVEVVGGPSLQVVHTPGQTAGHVAYHVEDVLLTGDLLQRDDVAWLPLDDGALDAAAASIERLGSLGARLAVPGHGPLVEDVPRAVEATLRTYERWRGDVARWAWHGARRLVAAQVALRPRVAREPLLRHLGSVPALAPMAEAVGATPAEVAARALADLLGSGALAVEGGVVVPRFPHEPHGPWRVAPAWGR